MKRRPFAAAFAGLALLASTAAVPIGDARAAEVVDEVVNTAEAVQARVTLPVRFDIDPVAKTLEAVALPGLEQGLDAAGEVVSAVKVPFELTTAPLASPADDVPPECRPSTTSEPNFTPYSPRYATRQEKDKLFLQYMFMTNQKDNARFLNNQWSRQFMECVAGGGRTFTNHEQTVNGAGSTMEDTATSLLINEGGMKWGTGGDPKGVKANLAFKVDAGPVSVTASVDGLGGSGYDGSQGPDKNAYYLNDYARNQVNGYWKSGFGGATEAYKGNVSLALWEYSMSDTVNRLTTIRNQAWMVYQCGSPWRFMSKCTTLGVAPAFDGPEITPETQTANSAGSARWDVLVPRDAQDPTTLAFDYGDGTPETKVTIPVGGGASTFTFSHTFGATGTYTQAATIVETGAQATAVTTAVARRANFVGYMYVRGANTGTDTVRAEGLDNWNGPQPMRQTITGPVVSSDKGGVTDGGNWFKVKTAGIDTNLRYLRAGTYDVNVQNGSSTADYGYDNHTTWNDPGGDCMTWTLGTNTKKVGQVTYLAGTDGVIDSAVDLNGMNITPDAAGYYKFTLPSGMNATNYEVNEQAVCISSLGSVNGNQAPLEILNVA